MLSKYVSQALRGTTVHLQHGPSTPARHVNDDRMVQLLTFVTALGALSAAAGAPRPFSKGELGTCAAPGAWSNHTEERTLYIPSDVGRQILPL